MEEYQEQRWYMYLKRKYHLSDDDMEEYIESFDIINGGENVTPESLRSFIYCETHDTWSKYECEQVIIKINKQINGNKRPCCKKIIIDLQTYLSYIIPICNDYVVTRIGIRELFDSLDKNGDGKITCEELTGLIYNVNYQLTPEEISHFTTEIKKICSLVDVDGDGYLSYNEFKKFIINGGLSKKKT